MRLFLAFLAWLVCVIPAVVIAGVSFDGLSSDSTESASSEDGNSNQASRFDADGFFGSGLIAGASAECRPDGIPFTDKKLRVRQIPCSPPKTSNEGNGKKDSSGQENSNNDGDTGNGHRVTDHPIPLFWQPPRPILPPLLPQHSDVCPPSKIGFLRYLICHEGLPIEIHDGGEWIQNCIWCDDLFQCLGTRWCCMGFWQLGVRQVREGFWPFGNGFMCTPVEDGFGDLQIPGLSL